MSEYSDKIRKAQEQIAQCNKVIAEIRVLEGNIATCKNYLGQISNSIEAGLVIEGKPADEGKISEIKNELSNVFFDTAPFSKKIGELKISIKYWKHLESASIGVKYV